MSSPKRISGPSDFEHECLYAFYQNLARKEKLATLPRLASLVLLMAAPGLVVIFQMMAPQTSSIQQIAANVSHSQSNF